MSPSELEFYDRLVAACPEYLVFSQVAMGGLIDPPRRLWGTWRSRARWRYQAKIVDFVVYDRLAAKVWCLVELDDPSHDHKKAEDAHRDAMTREAGYVTLRWDVREMPSVEAIRESIETLKVNRPSGVLEMADVPAAVQNLAGSAGRRAVNRAFSFVLKAALVKLVLPIAFILCLLAALPSAVQWAMNTMVSSVGRNASVPAQQHRPTVTTTTPSASVQAPSTATQVSVTPAVYQWWSAHRHTLRRTGHCANYGPWADELVVEKYSDEQMLDSLNRLLADARANACVDPLARRR